MKKEPIYIIDGLRTPLGRKRSSFDQVSISQLTAPLFKEIIRHNKIDVTKIQQVVLGNTVSAGTGQNFVREAMALAEWPLTIPAYSLNNVCGSSLQAVIHGVSFILSDQADIFIAGGAESVSQSPALRYGWEEESFSFVDSTIRDGLTCSISKRAMGSICEQLARDFCVTREEQDQYSFESHRKACEAKQRNKFFNEIVSVTGKAGILIQEDEMPRKNISRERLSVLPSAFEAGGSITAGNSSHPCDGAAIVLLASSRMVEESSLVPRARIIGYQSIAVDPQNVFLSAKKAIIECLSNNQMTAEDIDLFEVCESFAAQALWTQKELKIDDTKMNILGGDIALGHPLGAAGARILVTLLHSLIEEHKKRGLCCICFGGGGAIAMIIEIENEIKK